jgi:hypothetical protein
VSNQGERYARYKHAALGAHDASPITSITTDSEVDCLDACTASTDCNAYMIGSAEDYNVAGPSACSLYATSWELDLTSISHWKPTGARNGAGATIPSSVGFKIPSTNIQTVKEAADAAACATACHASVDGCLSFNYGYQGAANQVSEGKTCTADAADTTTAVDSADDDAVSLEKCNAICNGAAACQRFTHYPANKCVYHNRADCVEEASTGAPNAGSLYRPSKSATTCAINTSKWYPAYSATTILPNTIVMSPLDKDVFADETEDQEQSKPYLN